MTQSPGQRKAMFAALAKGKLQHGGGTGPVKRSSPTIPNRKRFVTGATIKGALAGGALGALASFTRRGGVMGQPVMMAMMGSLAFGLGARRHAKRKHNAILQSSLAKYA